MVLTGLEIILHEPHLSIHVMFPCFDDQSEPNHK